MSANKEAIEARVLAEMPQYQSHKKVGALKIADLSIRVHDLSAVITPADKKYAPFETRGGWGERFEGSQDDLGYFIRYADGFTSWSPTKAFEDGYTSI